MSTRRSTNTIYDNKISNIITVLAKEFEILKALSSQILLKLEMNMNMFYLLFFKHKNVKMLICDFMRC